MVSGGHHRVRGAAVTPPPRAGEVPCPFRHRGDLPWGVGSGHSQWYVQVGVVGHLGWLWLLWGRRGAVAARSGGYGDTTDLEAVACSVGAGGGPLRWWFNVPTTSPKKGNDEMYGWWLEKGIGEVSCDSRRQRRRQCEASPPAVSHDTSRDPLSAGSLANVSKRWLVS